MPFQELQEESVERQFSEEENMPEDLFYDENFQSKNIEEREFHTLYNGDYAPYFPNATTFMLFTWCTKHMISKSFFSLFI